MGCDIVLYAERRSDVGWELIDPEPEPCILCSDDEVKGCYVCDEPESFDAIGVPGTMRGSWYQSRHRTLFTALSGFGARGDADVGEPIAPARGLPDDLSQDLAAWLRDPNTLETIEPSWLTLEEIGAWPRWDEPIAHRGWVTAEGFRCRQAGEPFSYAVDIGGAAVPVSNDEMSARIEAGGPVDDRVHTFVEFTRDLRTDAAEFLEAMDRIRDAAGPDARIVFFYGW